MGRPRQGYCGCFQKRVDQIIFCKGSTKNQWIVKRALQYKGLGQHENAHLDVRILDEAFASAHPPIIFTLLWNGRQFGQACKNCKNVRMQVLDGRVTVGATTIGNSIFIRNRVHLGQGNLSDSII